MSDSEEKKKELMSILTSVRSKCSEKQREIIPQDYEDLVVIIDSAIFYLEQNEVMNAKKEIQDALEILKQYEDEDGYII